MFLSNQGSRTPVVFFCSCVGRTFGGQTSTSTSAIGSLMRKADISAVVPENHEVKTKMERPPHIFFPPLFPSQHLCCGLVFDSRGFRQQGRKKLEEVISLPIQLWSLSWTVAPSALDSLRPWATPYPRRKFTMPLSHQGLAHTPTSLFALMPFLCGVWPTQENMRLNNEYPLTIMDSTVFIKKVNFSLFNSWNPMLVLQMVLPRVSLTKKNESILVHVPCSSTQMGTNWLIFPNKNVLFGAGLSSSMISLASLCAEKVELQTVPAFSFKFYFLCLRSICCWVKIWQTWPIGRSFLRR